MGLENLVSTLPEIMALIPTILYVSQIFIYIILMLFYGSIAMVGFRKRKTFVTGLLGRLVTGALCVLAGTSLSGFVPFFNKGFLKVLQIDTFIAGSVASILLLIALRLITYRDRTPSPGEVISKLQKKVTALEELLKSGGKQLSEKDARKIAEKEMDGFKAEKAKLAGHEWNIELKKGEKSAKMTLDAWDGEAKAKAGDDSGLGGFFRDPHKVSGLAIMLAVIIASVVFFEGFPNPGESFTSMFGLTMDDFANLSQSMKDLPPFLLGDNEGCISPIALAGLQSQLQDQEFVRSHVYENQGTKALVEGDAGEAVIRMIKMDHEGKEVILAVTEGLKLCYLTDGKFCGCLDSRQ